MPMKQNSDKIRVLVVEDDKIISKVLGLKLEEKGYQVVNIVKSGEDAIKEAIEKMPNVVLMDIHLQGKIDGIMATQFIDALLHIPVIFLSSHDDNETIRKASLVNPASFLKKPFKSSDVFNNIEIVYSKHQKTLRNLGIKPEELFQKAKMIASDEKRYFLTGKNGEIIYLNNAAVNFLNIKRKCCILNTINECLPIRLESSDNESDTTSGAYNQKVTVMIHGRSYKSVLKAEPIEDPDGEKIGLLIELIDAPKSSKPEI